MKYLEAVCLVLCFKNMFVAYIDLNKLCKESSPGLIKVTPRNVLQT